MTKKRRKSVDWFVWLQWALASGLGAAVGFALADAVLRPFSEALYDAMAEVVIFGLIGAMMGILQWLVLRRHFSQVGWWVAASAVGGTLVGIGGAYYGNKEGQVNLTVFYSLVGSILGALQWLLLRRRISRSGWWVVASLLGWALALPVIQSLDRLGLMRGLSDAIVYPLGFGLMGTVVGIVTGGLLVWLLWLASGRPVVTVAQKPA
jgi:drug/metabolite transporter (DMT)-like permease